MDAYNRTKLYKSKRGAWLDTVMRKQRVKSHGSLLFHAGTKGEGDHIVTNGGRVLAVSSYGDTISEAASHSLAVLKDIHFEGMYYRKDIGYEFE